MSGNMADIMLEAAENFIKVSAADISHISYQEEGFDIVTADGKKYTVAKLVLDSGFSVDAERLSVSIHTDNEQQLNYNSGKNKNKIRPEFWAFRSEKLEKEQMVNFLKRKRHAFMCVS
jgi:hypothetical protein